MAAVSDSLRRRRFRARVSSPGWRVSGALSVHLATWGPFFLKFIISHRAVNCAIPANSKVKHMNDNMQAGRGRLPNAEQRARMASYFESL